MRVLVTGGRGFIGSYVCEALRREGHEAIVFDHRADQVTSVDVDGFIFGDVRDATAVTEAAAHVEGIIHLAAVLGTAETIDNPRPSAEINVLGSLNVLEAATQYDLPVVYAAVGNHHLRSTGAGAYVITKSCVEDFCIMFRKYRGTRVNIVRPMNAYGPGQSAAAPYGWSKVRKIMPAFVCRALSGKPIEVYGDGDQISDMVFVGDVARVFVRALTISSTLNYAVEVGPELSATVNEVAEVVSEMAAKLSGREPSGISHVPMRRGEPENAIVQADVDTMRYVVDWEFTPLRQGVEQTVRWFADNEGVTWHKP